MKMFRRLLSEKQPEKQDGRRWVLVLADQLTDQLGILVEKEPEQLGLVIVENIWYISRRPYTKQKVAMLLSNLRHFAVEQASRGLAVRHLVAHTPYRDALRPIIEEVGRLHCMQPTERTERQDIQELVDEGLVTWQAHQGWLVPELHDVERVNSTEHIETQDSIHRQIHKRYNYASNHIGRQYEAGAMSEMILETQELREVLKPPTFPMDPIKKEIALWMELMYRNHTSSLKMEQIPASQSDIEMLWQWCTRLYLPMFAQHRKELEGQPVFHHVSALLNMHRLLPSHVLEDLSKIDAPFDFREACVEKLLVWRESAHHWHTATDGFRQSMDTLNIFEESDAAPVRPRPGDCGYRAWKRRSWHKPPNPSDLDGGAVPSALKLNTPVLPMFWGEKSGMSCFDKFVENVGDSSDSLPNPEGTLLSDMSLLLDVNPRDYSDWYWTQHTDSTDWSVESQFLPKNERGLERRAETLAHAGEVFDHSPNTPFGRHCGECQFDIKSNCPVKTLRWAFLSRHEDVLQQHPSFKRPLAMMERRTKKERKEDQSIFKNILKSLRKGESIDETTVERKSKARKTKSRTSKARTTQCAPARKVA